MTDDQARNVQQYEYDSFGNQHDMKNRIKQPYGYTGREHDRIYSKRAAPKGSLFLQSRPFNISVPTVFLMPFPGRNLFRNLLLLRGQQLERFAAHFGTRNDQGGLSIDL